MLHPFKLNQFWDHAGVSGPCDCNEEKQVVVTQCVCRNVLGKPAPPIVCSLLRPQAGCCCLSSEVSLPLCPSSLAPQVDVFSELHLISDQSREYLRKGLMAVDQHIHAGYDASTFTLTGEASLCALHF